LQKKKNSKFLKKLRKARLDEEERRSKSIVGVQGASSAPLNLEQMARSLIPETAHQPSLMVGGGAQGPGPGPMGPMGGGGGAMGGAMGSHGDPTSILRTEGQLEPGHLPDYLKMVFVY